MQTDPNTLCFCTLALTPLYRAYARALAIDLEIYSPNTSFLVFTDRPADFATHDNVITVVHKLDGIVKAYHDKRFVIERALHDFDACVFLDSDMRITAPVDANLYHALPSGLNTYYCDDWDSWDLTHTKPGQLREKELVKDAAELIGVSTADCTFMWEQVAGIRGDSKGVDKFLSVWDQLAKHFQLKGLHRGIGHAMALAAAAADLPILQTRFLGESGVFKDLFVLNKQRNDLPVSTAEELCGRQHALIAAMFEPNRGTKVRDRLRVAFRTRRFRYVPPKSWTTLNSS